MENNKIYIIEYNNGLSYEENETSLDDNYFTLYRDASQYLLDRGFKIDTSFYDYNPDKQKYLELDFFILDTKGIENGYASIYEFSKFNKTIK